MFDQIISRASELKAQMDAMRKEAAGLAKPLLSKFVKDNPQVVSVKWTQYTPYFNDGDECVFRVHDPEFYFAGDDIEDEGKSVWRLDHKDYGPTDEQASPETRAACKALAKSLGQMEDVLKELFGDHVEVIVTSDGVEVEEYSHD